MLSSARPRLLVRPLAAVALAAPLVLAGCGQGDPESGQGPRVVASFYPLAWVAEQVAGDDREVTNLTQPGGEPHDLELGIAQTAELDRADLVVLLDGFQPAVDEAVRNIADAEVLDAAEVVELLPLDEHQHAGEEAGHGGDDVDPHFWLDPLLMADLGEAVATQLAALDPAGAEKFAAHAAALRRTLERLDAAYRDGLSQCRRDTVVVSHDAFGYLGRYGLRFEAIAGLSPDAEPTPADLARLQQLIRTEGVTTVFSERLASPAMAQALARDMGVGTAILDPIEGPDDDAGGGDYVALMEENLAALQEAGAC